MWVVSKSSLPPVFCFLFYCVEHLIEPQGNFQSLIKMSQIQKLAKLGKTKTTKLTAHSTHRKKKEQSKSLEDLPIDILNLCWSDAKPQSQLDEMAFVASKTKNYRLLGCTIIIIIIIASLSSQSTQFLLWWPSGIELTLVTRLCKESQWGKTIEFEVMRCHQTRN